MVIGLIATITAPEPEERVRPPASLADAVLLPFGEFSSG